MKNNELQFIELIETNKNFLVKKLENTIKTNVVYQLSRPMLNDLVTAYKCIEPNYQLSCSNCGAIILDFVKRVGNKYKELKNIQENELNLNQEIEINLLDYSNKNGEKENEKREYVVNGEIQFLPDTKIVVVKADQEKNNIIDFDMYENNEKVDEVIEQKIEETILKNTEKLIKRGRPKSK